MSSIQGRHLWMLALPVIAGLGLVLALVLRKGDLPGTLPGPKQTQTGNPPASSSPQSHSQEKKSYIPRASQLLARWNEARIGTPDALAQLEGELGVGNVALMLLKEPQATIPLLEGVLGEPRHSEVFKESILAAMEMHPGEPLILMLVRVLEKSPAVLPIKPSLIETTARLLGSIREDLTPAGTQAAAALHERLLQDGTPQVRASAIAATFSFPSSMTVEDRMLELFTRFASERDPVVAGTLRSTIRNHAELSQLRLKEAVSTAFEKAGDDAQAALALGILGDLSPNEVRPKVLAAMNDPRPDVRMTAILLTASGGMTEAVPGLASILSKATEQEHDLYDASLRALTQLGTPEAAAAIAAQLKAESYSSRRTRLATDLASVPAIKNDPALGGALAEALAAEQSPEVQRRLEGALAANGTPDALNRLQQRFASVDDSDHRNSLASLLLSSPAAADFAVREFAWLLSSPMVDEGVDQVVKAQPGSLLPSVREAYVPAKTEALPVFARVSMIRGLGALGTPAARQELKRIHGFDVDEGVQSALKEALERRKGSP